MPVFSQPDPGDTSTLMPLFCTILRMGSIIQPSIIRRSLRLSQQERLRVTMEDPQKDSEAHDHLFHEIAFIASGHAEHHTATGVERICAGDLIVIRPQIWHAYLKCRRFAVINCLFNSPLLYQLLPLLADAPQMTDLLRARQHDLASSAPVVIHTHTRDRAEIHALLRRMLREQNRRRRAWQASCTADLLQLLVLITRLFKPNTRQPVSTATDSAILSAAHYIEAHFTDAISLASLAAQAGVSKGHLSRYFSSRMGLGVVDYQHRLRIEEACRLLRLTDFSITQIAIRTGYSEVAYFSRCFRKMIGISAREYRRGQYAEKPRREENFL